MSQRYTSRVDGTPVVQIDATAGGETHTLTAGFAPGRQYVVERVDGSANTVTVQADGGDLLNGTPDGSITVPGWESVTFDRLDAAWRTVGFGGGEQGAGASLADGSVSAVKLGADVPVGLAPSIATELGLAASLAAKADLTGAAFTGAVTVPAASSSAHPLRFDQAPQYPNSSGRATVTPRAAWIDVRDYGAVGDDATNDTAAIQAAEDAAAALAVLVGARVGLLFSGSYAIGGSLVKKAGTRWFGQGRIRRIDNAAPTGACFALVKANAVNNWSIEGLSLENVPNDVNLAAALTRSAANGSENACVDVYGCSDWSVERCTITKFTMGIRHQASANYRIVDNTLRALPSNYTRAQFLAALEDGTYNTLTYAISPGGGIVVMYAASGPAPATRDYIIRGNYVDTLGLDIGIEGLQQTYDESPGLITGNIVNGARVGIQMYRGSFTDPGTAPTWDARAVISSNFITNTWEQGIYMRTAYAFVVTGNLLYRTGRIGDNGTGTSAGGIVTRADPQLTTFSSPLTDNTGSLITSNMLIDTGKPDGSLCNGAIQVRTQSTVVRGNVIVRSVTPTFNASHSDLGVAVDLGENLQAWEVSDNTIIGHHKGIHVSGTITAAASSRRNLSREATWKIQRNRIERCLNAGISVDSNRVGGLIADNLIAECGNQGTSPRGISLRGAPACAVERNKVIGATVGIGLSSGCLASDIPRQLSGGAITAARRRGGSLIVRDNVLIRCTTPYSVSETSGSDASFHGRCAVWQGDVVDGVPVESLTLGHRYASGTAPSSSTARTWNLGEVAHNSTLTVGATPGKVCITPGTYGDATTSTGDTTSGSPVITAVSSLDGYGPGIYITATGFTGARRIIAVDVAAGSITVDANASSSNVGVTLTVATPTFASLANLV